MATGTSSRDGEPQATAAPPSEASVEDHDSAGGAEPAAGPEEAVPQPSAAAGRRRTGPGHGRGGRDHLEDLEDDEDDFSTADEATRMARALATSSLRHMEAVADVVAAFAGSMVEADEDR